MLNMRLNPSGTLDHWWSLDPDRTGHRPPLVPGSHLNAQFVQPRSRPAHPIRTSAPTMSSISPSISSSASRADGAARRRSITPT